MINIQKAAQCHKYTICIQSDSFHLFPCVHHEEIYYKNAFIAKKIYSYFLYMVAMKTPSSEVKSNTLCNGLERSKDLT